MVYTAYTPIVTLTGEHRANETLWTSLDATLALIEQGVAAPLDAGQVYLFGRTYR